MQRGDVGKGAWKGAHAAIRPGETRYRDLPPGIIAPLYVDRINFQISIDDDCDCAPLLLLLPFSVFDRARIHLLILSSLSRVGRPKQTCSPGGSHSYLCSTTGALSCHYFYRFSGENAQRKSVGYEPVPAENLGASSLRASSRLLAAEQDRHLGNIIAPSPSFLNLTRLLNYSA